MTNRDTYDIESAKWTDWYERLLEIAHWHARLQIEFEKEVLYFNQESST